MSVFDDERAPQETEADSSTNTPQEIYNTTKKSILGEHWAKAYWRPSMAWLYMIICLCDFVIFPVTWAIINASTGQPVTQWKPITLEGAGLIHLAFGAILGVTAYGRSKEKLNR